MKINLSKNTKKVINWTVFIGGSLLTSIISQKLSNDATYEGFKEELRQGKFKIREID